MPRTVQLTPAPFPVRAPRAVLLAAASLALGASILASRPAEGGQQRTRPLCPFPQVAKYKGQGSTDDAANFVCEKQ